MPGVLHLSDSNSEGPLPILPAASPSPILSESNFLLSHAGMRPSLDLQCRPHCWQNKICFV